MGMEKRLFYRRFYKMKQGLEKETAATPNPVGGQRPGSMRKEMTKRQEFRDNLWEISRKFPGEKVVSFLPLPTNWVKKTHQQLLVNFALFLALGIITWL